MATPAKNKSKMQLLEELGPLTSGGIIAGTGGGAGQAFTGKESGTDFVNADKLVEANKGKGAVMSDNALSGQIDETADFSDLSALNSYDPNKQLKTVTAPTKTANRSVERTDDQGNVWEDNFKDSTTGPTTTTYNGWTNGDLDAKAEKIRGLSTQFQDFGKSLTDSPEGTDRRASLLNDKLKKNISTYSAGQNSFDSFLAENEGQGGIQSKADKVRGLSTKFDGLDTTVGNVRSGINAATGKVGVVDGITTTEQVGSKLTKAAPVIPSSVSINTDGLTTGVDGAFNQDPTKTSIKDIQKNITMNGGIKAVNNIFKGAVVNPTNKTVGAVDAVGSGAKKVADTVVDSAIVQPTAQTAEAVKGVAKQVKKWRL